MLLVERPHLMCVEVIRGLAQLGDSACNDLGNRNALGFITRQRQIQELYIKTLYLLLIAEPPEQAHMIAGEMPNSMANYYRKINDAVFHNQLDWEAATPGLRGESFTIMDTLNEGAHVSFKSLFMAKGYFDHPELVMTPERFSAYIKDRIAKLHYMHGMFQARKPREHVLEGMQTLHRPASYWEEQQRKARASPE